MVGVAYLSRVAPLLWVDWVVEEGVGTSLMMFLPFFLVLLTCIRGFLRHLFNRLSPAYRGLAKRGQDNEKHVLRK